MENLEQSLASSRFAQQGYVVLRQFCPADRCAAMLDEVRGQLDPVMGPVEFEADIGYPGAPGARDAAGGDTPRRLLNACSRFPSLKRFATSAALGSELSALTGTSMLLSQAHHNCVMTKHPGYSSATLWHQDIRYWSFDRPELVSCWLALGEEIARNGALRVIPGSHLLELDRGRLDRDLFLRPELAENKTLIRNAEAIELEPGDVLLFHCRLFHAAGKNLLDAVKLSAVFTYYAADNKPIPGTRSALLPGIEMQPSV